MEDQAAKDEFGKGSFLRDGSKEGSIVLVGLNAQSSQKHKLTNRACKPTQKGVEGEIGDEQAVKELQDAAKASGSHKGVYELQFGWGGGRVRRPE